MASFFVRTAVCLAVLIASLLLVVRGPLVASEDATLAIGGYDPVAYFVEGKATRGSPDIEYEWDEHRYRFSRAEHRDIFKADPVRYAPQFANYCAMALARGEVVEANPEYWLISGGKLYLFGAAPGVGIFQRDPAGIVDKAGQQRQLIPSR